MAFLKDKTMYLVSGPLVNDLARFGDKAEARAEVVRRLPEGAEIPELDAANEAVGGVSWSTYEDPATVLDAVVLHYGYQSDSVWARNPDEAAKDWGLNRDAEYVLVEVRGREGHLLTSVSSLEEATAVHDHPEKVDDYAAEELINVRTGEYYHPKTERPTRWQRAGSDWCTDHGAYNG